MSNPKENIEKKEFELYGIPWYFFIILAVIVFVAAAMQVLPANMIGAFAIMIVLGTLFNELGNHLPIVKTYLGGGPIIIIFGSATIALLGTVLANGTPMGEASSASILRTADIIKTFMKDHGFLDFYIAALITGSILGMNRKLLINAAVRYLPAILGGVVVAISLSYFVGTITGYGGRNAVFFVTIPIMGGGIGAGATPLSKVFEANLGNTSEYYMSIMVPAIALANAFSITVGGLLNRFGKRYPKLSGEGRLLRDFNDDSANTEKESLKDSLPVTVQNLGIGLLMATTFFSFGAIVSKIIPGGIHTYAWMILSVAIAKMLGLIPEKFEVYCHQWYTFIMSNLTPSLLVGIGFTYTNLADVAAALSNPVYILLVVVTVLGAITGASIVGWIVGFFPIESAITAGLCMSDMGGTGDVAILSASKRMVLMPFAQISTRIGGASMLLLTSFLVKIFFPS